MQDPYSLIDLCVAIHTEIQSLKKILSDNLPKDKDEDEFLDKRQTAVFLKLSISTIEKMAAHRLLPAYKPHGKLYFKKSELINHIKNSRQGTIEELAKEAYKLSAKKDSK